MKRVAFDATALAMLLDEAAQVDAFCTLDGAQARMARRLMPGALTGLPSELMAALV